MRRLIYFALTTCVIAAQPVQASLTLTVDPVDGVITGTPGATVGWGFTFTTNDSNTYLPTFIEFCIGAAIPNTGTCNNTAVGDFTDFASALNLIIIGPGFNPSGYSEVFHAANQTGLGSFSILPGAVPQQLMGTIYLYYDVYDGDPFSGAIQLPSSQTSQLAMVDILDRISVPEPASVLLIGSGLALVCCRRKRTLRSAIE